MANADNLILNRYRPIAEAGMGGFATVQVAWDTRIQRRVAIKCIQLDEEDTARAFYSDEQFQYDPSDTQGLTINLLEDEAFQQSLPGMPGLDEARTAAMLNDASIVAVYDFEIQDSTAYLIMEYVEGMSLGELLSEHQDELTLDGIAAVFAAVARALEVAHSNQVLHLDIKPDNILINHQGQVKVTDFGLATLADSSGFGTAGGGTIGYMPLEQMREEMLDVRCDEWALASVTYEMIVGENPFLAPDLMRAASAIEDAELVLPSLCWDELDPAADDPIFFALDPNREERYATVSEFAEELEPYLGSARRGVRELAAIVMNLQDEDEDNNESEEEWLPPVPLCEQFSAAHRVVAAHAIGAIGSAFVALVALMGIPQTSEFTSPLFWVFFVLIILAGALKPHLGALLSYAVLAIAGIMQGQPAIGFVLLAAVGAWWYFMGRDRHDEANVVFALPLSGAFGLSPLAPLIAGFVLSPLRAVVVAGFSVLLAIFLIACAAESPFVFNVLNPGYFGIYVSQTEGLTALLTQPAFWAIALSWVISAGLLSLFRLRHTRVFSSLGVGAAGVILLFGLGVACWIVEGTTLFLGRDLVAVSVSLLAMFGACAFVYNKDYCDGCEDEDDYDYDDGDYEN